MGGRGGESCGFGMEDVLWEESVLDGTGAS